MATFTSPLHDARRPGSLARLRRFIRDAGLALLGELRRAILASWRHDELRDALARRSSYLDISRQVVGEVYGDRLPHLLGGALPRRDPRI